MRVVIETVVTATRMIGDENAKIVTTMMIESNLWRQDSLNHRTVASETIGGKTTVAIIARMTAVTLEATTDATIA